MNRPSRSASPPAPESADGGWPLGAVFTLLLLAAFAAYLPCLRGDFLWDDAGHVTSPQLESWSGLLRIWFEPGVTQQYYPLLHSAFWLEHQLWGEATLGYHLVNVLWHATAATLLVAVLRQLRVAGALLAGTLFALHPVCVESVAWISEQKNTLSTVFYLAAALVYLKFNDARLQPQNPKLKTYLLATALFVCALLTKTVTATLPAALLVLAWWRRGRISWRGDVLPLLPWFAAGIGAGLFTVWFERTGIGAQGSDFSLSLLERGLLAGRVVWFYLGKLLWPANLAFFYPRWEIDATVAWQYLFPAAAILLLAVALLVAASASEPIKRLSPQARRAPLAALLLFGGTLFPVVGFFNVYPFLFSYVADHFQYLASLPLFALAAGAFMRAARSGRLGLPWRGAQALAVGIVALLAALTWQQSKDYVDSITLYRATLARNPDSWVAHHNLASELSARGAAAEALPHAQRATELKPDYPEALNNLADNLSRTGRAAEALPLLRRALQLQPRYAEAENNLGIALGLLGRGSESIDHFRRAIALQPRLAEAHYNLGLAEADRGDFAVAIPHFAEAVRLRPNYPGAELHWGVALALTHRLAEARPHFERAITLDPESIAARQTYARVLLNAGDLESAAQQFRDALQLNPALPGVHRDLAIILRRLGRLEEAQYHAIEADRRR